MPTASFKSDQNNVGINSEVPKMSVIDVKRRKNVNSKSTVGTLQRKLPSMNILNKSIRNKSNQTIQPIVVYQNQIDENDIETISNNDLTSNEISSENLTDVEGKKSSTPIINIKKKRKKLKSNNSPIKSHEQLKSHSAVLRARLQRQAVKAYNSRKIFTVYGNYKSIRHALKRRGWVEKIPQGHLRRLQELSEDLLIKLSRPGNDYERVLLSKLASNYPSFFIWQPKHSADKYQLCKPFRNRIRIAQNLDFSTKQGLIGCTENAHWNTFDGDAELNFPRFYRLNAKNNSSEFLIDYRSSQCVGLVNYLASIQENNRYYDKINGTILKETIDFAIEQIINIIKNRRNVILEADTFENSQFWNLFIDKCRKIVHGKAMLKLNRIECFEYLQKCRKTIEKLKKIRPHLNRDGYNNIWILKPGFSSRGHGIIIMTDYDDIIEFASKRPNERYIVQKYIERPLLIYKTKFDIRQFFILSINKPIRIWMYKTCYLRFSSKQFSLFNFHESIHLTNYSVQKKYPNGVRDKRLPENNMWHLEDFQRYLNEINEPNIWTNKIYPGMKRNIIGIVLSSLESTTIVPNTFEFFGCDFMLDEDFEPILLEVNATPDMSNSTRVTAKICPTVLEDMIKVIVDSSEDIINPATGDFEIAYTLSCPDIPNPENDLSIQGSQIKPTVVQHIRIHREKVEAKKQEKNISGLSSKQVTTSKIITHPLNKQQKPTLAVRKQYVTSEKPRGRFKKKGVLQNPFVNEIPVHKHIGPVRTVNSKTTMKSNSGRANIAKVKNITRNFHYQKSTSQPQKSVNNNTWRRRNTFKRSTVKTRQSMFRTAKSRKPTRLKAGKYFTINPNEYYDLE